MVLGGVVVVLHFPGLVGWFAICFIAVGIVVSLYLLLCIIIGLCVCCYCGAAFVIIQFIIQQHVV